MKYLDSTLLNRVGRNTIFKTDHDKVVHSMIAKFDSNFDVERLNEKQIELLKERRMQFQTLVIHQYTKYLQLNNIPSWTVTGRGNYNHSKYERQMSRMSDQYKEMERRIEKFTNNTKKMIESKKSGDQIEEEIKSFMKKEKENLDDWRGGNDIVKTNFYGRLSTKIKNGWDPHVVKKYYDEYGFNKHFTQRHRIHNLFEKTEQVKKENKTYEYEDFIVVLNYDMDRIQLQHYEIPPKETRDKLKRNGFRFSPKQRVWQRKITKVAIELVETMFQVEL